MALSLFRDHVLNSPFGGGFMHFPDEFSTLLDAPLSTYVRDSHAMATTAVDVKETPTAYNFVADLPGLKREEVKVQLEEGNVLAISGQRTREEKKETDTYHRMERSTGSFMRKFRLPNNADTKNIKASAENGVLTIVVPKSTPPEPEKPKVVDVQVN
jgi:HSP20 family protein